MRARAQAEAVLSRQDWRGADATWTPGGLGYWEVLVERTGRYDLEVIFNPASAGANAQLKAGTLSLSQSIPAGQGKVRFDKVMLEKGPLRLETWIEGDGRKRGVNFVKIRRR